MEQLEFFAIPSPCCGVCESDLKGYCKGCLRKRDERQMWFRMSDVEKRHVLFLCNLRRRKLMSLRWQSQQGRDDSVQLLQFNVQVDLEFD